MSKLFIVIFGCKHVPQHYLASKKVRDMSLDDFMNMSDKEAFLYLVKARWPDGMPICPDCGSIDNHYFIRTRKQWRCKHCHHTFSVTSGTLLADRKMPYRKILLGIFLFTSKVNGKSALELSRDLGVNPKTAWLFFHKLKEGIILNQDLTPFQGKVEIDGTYIGGKLRKSRVRNQPKAKYIADKIESKVKTKRKMSANDYRNWQRRKKNRRLILVFREIHEKHKLGARRTLVVLAKKESEEFVKPVVNKMIIPGTTIMTDECGAYNFLSAHYDHYTVEHKKEFATLDGINNNQAESYNSRLKRWYYGIAHRMTPQYAYDYACEMAWREDMRRESEKTRFKDVISKTLKSKPSGWWRGYHQGHRRNDELLMYF